MATAFFAWQLGAGFGHLMRMLPLAQGLVARGHRVVMAFRNLSHAAEVYGRTGIQFLQAPAKATRRLAFPKPISFAHLLGNTGFGSDYDLFGIASAWRNLFRLVQPDLIVFDHSPAALLAARGLPCRRALVGTGYCCPPDTFPLAAARSTEKLPIDGERLAADEEWILKRVNAMLGQWKQPPLQRLGQLYGEVDECFLTTFRELDHFPQRSGGAYWGPVNATAGHAPEWPNVPGGKRIFAYLKASAGLTDVLQLLRERMYPAIVHVHAAGTKFRERFETETLRIVGTRLDPALAAAQCDVAILNATHGTTCDVLLAGKPILQLPLHGEQELVAEATCRIGAGTVVLPKREGRAEIERALDSLMSDPCYAKAGAAFAARHNDFDPERQRTEMVRRACELLAGATFSREAVDVAMNLLDDSEPLGVCASSVKANEPTARLSRGAGEA